MERARVVPGRIQRAPEARRREDRLQRFVRRGPVQGRQAHLAVTPSASAVEWLLSFSDPKRGVGWNRGSRGGLPMNLRRTRVLLDLAGSPDRRMFIVLVGGTKGKGSTAAMLASLLSASGVRAGLSTKPHLQSYRERVRVDGAAIDDEALAARVAELRPVIRELEERLPDAG